MRTPIVDGRSIEQFIPANLRGMFYKNAIPQYKYAIHDGYDPYGFSTKGLVLYLPLWALKDSAFKSVDAYRHTATVTNATWLPSGRNFDGAGDFIEIPNHSSLDITTENFWITAWVYPITPANDDIILIHGLSSIDGFFFWLPSATSFGLQTDPGAIISRTADATLAAGAWQHLGATRIGAAVKLYKNGVDITDTAGNHTATLDSSSRTMKIGCYDDKAQLFWHGRMGEIKFYKGGTPSPVLVQQDYNATKWRYQ